MRKVLFLALGAAVALAACSKKPSDAAAVDHSAAPAAASASETKSAELKMPDGFPKLKASYKGVYDIDMGERGGLKEATFEIASWKRLRMEMPHFDAARAAAGDRLVTVFDDANRRALVYVDGKDAPKAAIVTPTGEQLFDSLERWGAEDGAPPKKVGTDSLIGMSCDIWESASSADDGDPGQICLTRDGVILWVKNKGAETAQLRAKSIERGAIPAERFALPAGFEVVDTTPCMKLAQEMMAAAKAGKQPDMAKMKTCQDLGKKAAAIMGSAE